MSYFRYLPKVYVRNRTIQNGVHPYELTVNIFRRIKIRDELQGGLLGFTQYEIGTGERPDQVASRVYGDSGLDWIVLLVNNIINVYEDWPLNRVDLYSYIQEKWGDPDQIVHYESLEIKIGNDVVFPEGEVVNEDFHYIKTDGSVIPKSQCRRAVTFYEREERKNEEKRNIYLLRSEYVTDFINEFKKLSKYLPHAEIDDDGNKKTETTLSLIHI